MNTAMWIASEKWLVDYRTPYEYLSEQPLKVRWQYWSVLEGEYEYSRGLQEDVPSDPTRPSLMRGTFLSSDEQYYFEMPGFYVYSATEVAIGFQKKHFRVKLDCWLIAFISGLFPAYKLFLAIRAFYSRRKAKSVGLCPTCSYDLRAHTPGSNCPECGTPISVDLAHPKPIDSNP